MVARTEARQPEQLAIVDPIWAACCMKREAQWRRTRCFRLSFIRQSSITGLWKSA